MGQARRRTLEIAKQRKDVKLTPRQQIATYSLMRVNRLERQDPKDGMIYAVNIFHVVDPVSKTVLAEEVEGSEPQPICLQSVPQPVRKGILLGPTSPSPILARG